MPRHVEDQIVCGKSLSVFCKVAIDSLAGRVTGYRLEQRHEHPHKSGRSDV